jgi:hypothetical protein
MKTESLEQFLARGGEIKKSDSKYSGYVIPFRIQVADKMKPKTTFDQKLKTRKALK